MLEKIGFADAVLAREDEDGKLVLVDGHLRKDLFRKQDIPTLVLDVDAGEHLCGLHFTPDKPLGCIASPFTLNANRTLIVRNRYKMLRCYGDGPRIPAWTGAGRPVVELVRACGVACHAMP